ncbi:MAG TPA: cation:proton antiporter, partial [Gammaproteobacteria bacterium]
MDTSLTILQVAAILIAARIFGELATWLRVPVVIGEILAGVILGPSLLAFVEPQGLIQVLAEIGIILLLFQVGLETDVGELARSGSKSVVVAIGGFALPLLTCFVLARYVFGLDLLVALMVAGTMTATSIGITMRTLTDLGRAHSHEGHIVLGAVVLDDILGVLLLAILFNFITLGSVDLAGTWRI